MNNMEQFVRQMNRKMAAMERELIAQKAKVDILEKLCDQPATLEDQIAAIPGRRIFFNLSGRSTFVATDQGRQGTPVPFQVSQDGPFIMTHYPIVAWRPTAPNNTPNFGLWRPVYSWPLPDQATPASGAFDLDEDIVAISWEFSDGGSQRNFQNEDSLPMFSSPNVLNPLPIPTMFTPNSTIQFFPVYSRIAFSSAPTITEAEMRVSLPGFRVANL